MPRSKGARLHPCNRAAPIDTFDSLQSSGERVLLTLYSAINDLTIHHVRNVCGAAVASALIDRCGGRRLYIPHTPSTTGQLAEAMDLPALERLCAALGGRTVVVPIGRRSGIRRTRLRVEKMLRAGRSASFIASRAGCCQRTVYSIKAEMRAAGDLPPREPV